MAMTHKALALAAHRGRPVAFDYRPRHGTPGPRIVSPWERRGAILYGFDHGRLAMRAFRLDAMRALRHAPPTVDYRPADRPPR